jgi:phosphohistidine phosphatase
MDLILWRHADARDVDDDMPDALRPLTPKGERQSRRVAQWLNQHLPDNARVLVSPTLRTRQTAEALGRKTRTLPDLGPDGSVEGLLTATRWPDSKEAVLVVGHQPTLGLAAAYLLAGVAQPWSVRKGALWWLRRRERALGVEVVLHTVVGPEQL